MFSNILHMAPDSLPTIVTGNWGGNCGLGNIWPSPWGLGQTQILQRGLGSWVERGAGGGALKDKKDRAVQVA